MFQKNRMTDRGRPAPSLAFWTSILLISIGVGCSTPNPQPPPPAPLSEAYVVGAPDQLAIHILPDPVIERTVRVRTDGKISVPELVVMIEAFRSRAMMTSGLNVLRLFGDAKRAKALDIATPFQVGILVQTTEVHE